MAMEFSQEDLEKIANIFGKLPIGTSLHLLVVESLFNDETTEETSLPKKGSIVNVSFVKKTKDEETKGFIRLIRLT